MTHRINWTVRVPLAVILVSGSAARLQAQQEPALATVNGVPVTLADMDPMARLQVLDLQQKAYDIQSRAVEQIVVYRLLSLEATRLGLTVDELLTRRVDALLVPATAVEVEERYQKTKDHAPPIAESELRQSIATQIGFERRQELVRQLVEEIKLRVPVQVHLMPPRVAVAPDGPQRGSERAPVTMVVFSDFQCEGCASAQETVAQLLRDYPEQVRLVYRHFPMDQIHPRARPAAVASVCAEQQGRFWEYHDRLYRNQARLAASDLVAVASELGLDNRAFLSCMNSKEAAARVQKDVDQAILSGVSSAPTFFVNGRPLAGAPPRTAFDSMLWSELARLSPGEGRAPTPRPPPADTPTP